MVVGTSATTNGGEGVRAALESVVTSNVRMHLAALREKKQVIQNCHCEYGHCHCYFSITFSHLPNHSKKVSL